MTRIGRRKTLLTGLGYTPSQYWAKRNSACLAGRRRLGRLSIREYWLRTCNSADLGWIARRLKPENPDLLSDYLAELNHPDEYVEGAWRYPSRMRKALTLIMWNYSVQWPSEIL